MLVLHCIHHCCVKYMVDSNFNGKVLDRPIKTTDPIVYMSLWFNVCAVIFISPFVLILVLALVFIFFLFMYSLFSLLFFVRLPYTTLAHFLYFMYLFVCFGLRLWMFFSVILLLLLSKSDTLSTFLKSARDRSPFAKFSKSMCLKAAAS